MKKILILWLVIILIVACGDDNAVIPSEENALYGLLVDENGNPISDAEICLIPDVENWIQKIETKGRTEKLQISIAVIELKSFSGQLINGKVELLWATYSEMNSKQFNIERAKVINGDSENFQKIGTVKAKGNSIETTDYSFIDSNVVIDNVYAYRLVIEDNDGSVDYIIQIIISFLEIKNMMGNNYPNPYYNLTSIPISLKKSGTVKLYLIEKSTGIEDLFVLEFNSGANTLNLSNTNNQGIARRPGVYQMKMVLQDTAIYGPNMILDYKFTKENCEIPQYITKSDKEGKFTIDYKWFAEETKYMKTNYNGQIDGELILSTKRKMVARKLLSESMDIKTYLIGIDSIAPVKNTKLEVKLVMKKNDVKK